MQGLVVRRHHPYHLIAVSDDFPARAIQADQTCPLHAIDIEMHDSQHRDFRTAAIHEHAVVAEFVKRRVHRIQPLFGRLSLRALGGLGLRIRRRSARREQPNQDGTAIHCSLRSGWDCGR